ncbi:uncharacterized protein [Lolium perenne]|uniref:uncharacterized protein isoform X3 n=1 Tax=Lolium perenne TaxID=4522 RepID=UPI0021EAD242|nr:probable E3 ubiquitin-protein ligase RHY1A [Lolium perenne]
MLPGVELARRRRVHYHGDVVGLGGGDHHPKLGPSTSHAATGMVGPALAARNRLQEKLRGAASRSSSTSSSSRWGWRTRERDNGASSRQHSIQQEQQQQDLAVAASTFRSPCPVPAMTATTSRRAEMRRTLSKADVCAVCLDEVRERHQRVTRLPCSHRYHSDCVLPWLAIQPDCPCCRTLVPSVETLS